jgi:hypothetical protein
MSFVLLDEYKGSLVADQCKEYEKQPIMCTSTYPAPQIFFNLLVPLF